MSVIRSLFVPLLVVSLGLVPAAARAQQPTAVTQSALDDAVAAHVSQADQDRQLIHRVLDREQVREIAASAGLDLKAAHAAVAMLDGAELERIAQQAQDVDNSLAGGQTVVITTTTIIVVLLVVILIVVAVD